MNLMLHMTVLGASRSDWRRRIVKLAALIWRRLLFRTTFIAVTGSVGKTTAKELLAAVLSSQAPTLATFDSCNAGIHVARTILRARPWHRFVVLEVATTRPGWIRHSALIARPNVAVILNVGRTHTDHFPALEDTAREKAALLSGLGRRGVAILNHDDARVAAMAEGRTFRVVRFGRGEQADVRATQISGAWPERLSLTLRARGGAERLETMLVGTHWADSVLGAAAAALECGVPLPRIVEVFKRVEPTPGRLDPRVLPSGAVVLRDDFNGTLETFAAAFRVLREARAGRKILVITTVSDSPETWDKRLRRVVCEAVGVCDAIVLVGAYDDAKRAAKTALAAGFPADAIHRFPTLRAAAESLRGSLRAGDLLLLRGRASDHMGRIYHAMVGEVHCWVQRCPLMVLCDRCPELFGETAGAPPFSTASLAPVPRRDENV